MDYTTKDTIMAIAIGGAWLNMAFSASLLVGDLLKGRASAMGFFNVAISALVLYLALNYEVASLIYGWLLLITTILTGLFMMRAHK